MHRPLRLTIDSSALQANWRWLQDRAGVPAGAAIKADGYGLGARETMRGAARSGMPRVLRVDLGRSGGARVRARRFEPGRPARRGPRRCRRGARHQGPASAQHCRAGRALEGNRAGPRMRRDDRHRHEPPRPASRRRSARSTALPIHTLHSHLACADEDMRAQRACSWSASVLSRAEVPAKRYSLANSAGICLGRDYSFDLVRPGLALYGGVPRREARRQHPPGGAGRGADRPAPHHPRRARPAAMARPSPPRRTPRPRSSTSAMPTAICAASPRAGRRSPANMRCRCSAACRWT